ncbi:alcohol dehydrogenase [Fusarium napiforme]|uniref:Alcohol dehydrogenase n=1 Tax=Fusarium napiforme TaxID=42672 RepID=A0A8H5K3R5_9HYPO|nr:alcohol dehydrogenase [Fusarium napiforme]
MSIQTSKSIFLSAQGELLVQPVTEAYTVEDSQCLVRVDYSAINLCDYNFFYMGLGSFITGFEMSGTVEQTGPDSRFQVGDTVFGISPVVIPMPSSHGTHQDLVVARYELLYKIPAGVSSKDASVICMPAHTAADALFNVIGLGLPAADVAGIDPVGKGILIWGGASSVGLMAIQLAKAAGLQYIFATASAKNHDILRELGATHCFDYKSRTVVEDIRRAQKTLGIALTLAFDTVCKGVMGPPDAGSPSTPELTKSSLGASEGLRLACTLPVHQDTAFGMCASYRPSGSMSAMGAPQDPGSAIRIRNVIEHLLAVKNGFLRLPVVTVVIGAEAGIEAIRRVAGGEMSLEKLTLKHPLEYL